MANAQSGARGTGAQAGRGRLTRPRVLAAAIDLADRQGLAALTMRRLAAELGVEPMALYRYASGKEALLDGMVEAFYGEVMDRLGPVRPGTGGARCTGSPTSSARWPTCTRTSSRWSSHGRSPYRSPDVLRRCCG